MSHGLGYTDIEQQRRWKLPKREVMVYWEGLLYKCQTGKNRNWGNGQNVEKNYTYFVKMSFRNICALTSHFVNLCDHFVFT